MAATAIRRDNLRRLFDPGSIAVIGASASPDKLGFAVVKNILDGGYRGRIYPVNPKAREILDLPCIRDAAELPDGIDLAIIVLPAEKIPGILRIVAARGVRAAVIPAGGFSETGAAGAAFEAEIRAVCAEHPLRVLGPNVPGFINARARLAATIAGGPVADGPLAVISQAGSVAYLLTRNLLVDGVRFGRFICVGNQPDVSEADVIDLLADDEGVKAICLYIESVKDGRRFLEVARRLSAIKPIIALKGGRTEAGHGAIFSHTASISSPERVYQAAFRKAGVVSVDSLRALGMVAFALARQRPQGGKRIAIVTSLAGVGVIAADTCERKGLVITGPSTPIRDRLKEILPPSGSLRNPFDLTGDVSPEMLARTIEVLAESDDYDGILPLVMGVPGSKEFGNEAYARAARPALAKAVARRKAVSVAWVMDEADGREISRVRDELHPVGVPVLTMPEDAVEVMAGLLDYARIHASDGPVPPSFDAPLVDCDPELARLRGAGASVLTEHAAKALFEKIGLPVSASRLAGTADEAVDLAEGLGFPVVLKIQSPAMTHKSEAGGVVLNLRDADEVRSAYREMVRRFRSAHEGAPLHGVSVQPMIAEKGVELICGIASDAQFGKYLLLGLGGTAAEVYGDASLRLLPIVRHDIETMLDELGAAPLLKGYRDAPAANRAAIVDFVMKFCRLGGSPHIEELEVNPLLASSRGVWALDARARLAPEGGPLSGT